MKLLSLQIENFRNYKSYTHKFDSDKNITVMIGANGIGKTNLLEAIYVLSLGKSFRTTTRDDLIKWDFDYMRCIGKIEKDNEEEEIEVGYSNYPSKKKVFKKNEVNLKNSEYIGSLLTVFFHPEDLNMLYLAPALRRRYMDILLSQTDKKYLDALMKYRKVLKQRNALLSQIRENKFKRLSIDSFSKDFEAWNDELIQFGAIIIEKRMELVDFLKEKLEKLYRSISGKKEKVEIQYINNILKKSTTSLGEADPATEKPPLHTIYREKLMDRVEKDVIQAKTISGPHRDDLKFLIDGKDILSSASRGEFRTLLLAIKLAEIEFIKKITGESPVLLLDDVFSELDPSRQEKLFQAIDDCQTIITTTKLSNVDKLAEISHVIDLDKVA